MNAQLPHASDNHGPGRPPDGNGVRAAGAALMTAATLEELRDELERLRARTRVEIVALLREARPFDSGLNNDEFHAAREEQLVLEARIASLEETIARAQVVDPRGAHSGMAVIGSVVLIEDLDSGAVSQHRLASAHHYLGRDTISAASPVGQALVGATVGTIVTVDLPNGNSRSVRLVQVTNRGSDDRAGQAAA
jgi:transcription elongation factor GreA